MTVAVGRLQVTVTVIQPHRTAHEKLETSNTAAERALERRQWKRRREMGFMRWLAGNPFWQGRM